jgi:hypothetical protein
MSDVFGQIDELVLCLPEKKWMSIYVHWAHRAACGHLGPLVPAQLKRPCIAGASLYSWSVLCEAPTQREKVALYLFRLTRY